MTEDFDVGASGNNDMMSAVLNAGGGNNGSRPAHRRGRNNGRAAAHSREREFNGIPQQPSQDKQQSDEAELLRAKLRAL